MSLNDRLVRIARLMAEAYAIQGEIMRKDPVEAGRFANCEAGAARLTKMADEWEGRIFVGFDPATTAKEGNAGVSYWQISPSGWRSVSFEFIPKNK